MGLCVWNYVEKVIDVNENKMLCRIKVDCVLNIYRSLLVGFLICKCLFLLVIFWYDIIFGNEKV